MLMATTVFTCQGLRKRMTEESEHRMPRRASGFFRTEPIPWKHGSIRNWQVASLLTPGWLSSDGVSEGPGRIVEVNCWLLDPAGSGAYRIPDVRISNANIIFDGTIGWKDGTTTSITAMRPAHQPRLTHS
jgi:hypothetical protein